MADKEYTQISLPELVILSEYAKMQTAMQRLMKDTAWYRFLHLLECMSVRTYVR